MRKFNLFGFFVGLLIFLQPVLATDYSMNFVLDEHQAKMCPCGQRMIFAALENTGSQTDTYILRAEPAWTTMPDTFTLAPGEKETVGILVAPGCQINSGDYELKITAESEHVSESEIIDLTILNCFGVELTSETLENTVCLGDETVFNLMIKNAGKSDDTFELSATKGTFSDDKITLERNETKIVSLTVPVTKESDDITVKAESIKTSVQSSLTLGVTGIDCYSAELTVQPDEQYICIGDVAEYDVSLKNTGIKVDTYTLSSDFGTLSVNQTSLTPDNKIVFPLKVSPLVAGAYDIIVSVISEKTELNKIVTLNARTCEGVAIIAWTPEETICKGEVARILTTIKNTGVKEDTFTISSTMGTPGEETFTLNAMETKGVYIDIPTADLEAEQVDFNVTVKSDKTSDVTFGSIFVEDCYSADLSVNPKSAEFCPCDSETYTITVKNTGKREDTYTLTSTVGELSDNSITLESKESQKITLTIAPKCGDVEEKGTIELLSDFVNQSETIDIILKSLEDCYAFDVTITPETIEGDVGEGYLHTVYIKNNGESSIKYDVSLDGPEWVYVNPAEFELKAGQEKEVYLYVSAPYETGDGIYATKISINTDKGIAKAATVKLIIGDVLAEPVEDSITGDIIITIDDNETDGAAEEISEESEKFTLPRNLIIAIVIGLIIILLIVFGPDLLKDEDEEDKAGEEKKEDDTGEKPEEEPKKRKRGRPPKKKSREKEIEEILDNI